MPAKLKHWKPQNAQEQLAWQVLKVLCEAGYSETYFVGGYVRDRLLGRASDPMIDLATEARPAQVKKLFKKASFRVIPTGLKHGTVTIRRGGEQVEITTFRTEGKYADHRRPKSVKYVATAKADAGRRDFSVNALYFNPAIGKFLDFFGGVKDLRARQLAFIGSAKERILEDSLRLMRAVRLASVLGFELSKKDLQAVKIHSKLIKKISAERIKQELDKLMLSSRASYGLKLLQNTGLLKEILPEADRLARTKQSPNYHSEGDVFTHTMLALDILEKDADLTTRYGMLFHDVGKGETAVKTKKHGRDHISFHGHQEIGEKLAKKFLSRLRFSNKETEDVTWYIRNHHAPVDIPKMRLAKQRHWLLEPRFGNLLKIFRADSSVSIPTDSKGRRLPVDMGLYKINSKLYRGAKALPTLRKVFANGRDVMRILKIKPGPKVGQVLERLRERQLEGEIKSKKAAFDFLKKFVGK